MSERPYQMNASLVVDIYFLALYSNRTLDINVFSGSKYMIHFTADIAVAFLY